MDLTIFSREDQDALRKIADKNGVSIERVIRTIISHVVPVLNLAFDGPNRELAILDSGGLVVQPFGLPNFKA